MKKRSLFLLFIVGLVGLFLPKGVFAAEYSLRYMSAIDYRFFLEDEDENDIEDKKFRLHDVNNLISYESEYDSNTKAYYFIDVPANTYNPYNFKIIEKGILPEYLNNELKNTDFNSFSNYEDWNDFITNLSQKYKGLDSYYPGLQFYIPMILEEVNHTGDGEPIKKVVFAVGLTVPGGIDENGNYTFMMQIMLVNNTCMYKDNYYPDEETEILIRRLSLTRNQTFDYSDEIINKYSAGNIASNEIQGDEYLNKGFLNDKFSTGEIASGDIASSDSPGYGSQTNNIFNGKQISAVKLRNSSDNLKEELLKDYCDCLPVFVQARKAPSIVEVITNPKTFTTGVMILVVSLLLALGFVAFILTNQKKSDNKA